jgi:hypothetical protein
MKEALNLSKRVIFILSGTADQVNYSFELNLYGEVVKDECKFSLETRNIFLNIKKKEKAAYWPRLTKENGKLNFVAVDWGHYIEEDDEDEEGKEPSRGNMQGKETN